MRSEDLNKFFEEALAKFQPKDEAQLAKLEKLREKIREANEEMGREIADIQQTMERNSEPQPSTESMKAIAHDRSRIAKETITGIGAAFDEHSDLIERIVKATASSQ